MALRRPHKRMKMAATFGRTDDAGGDVRGPSLDSRLRGKDHGIAKPHKGMKTGGVLRQGIRLAACVYVPGAEAPGLTSLQTPDFSPGEFGCLAHRPIFIAMTVCGFRDNGKALFRLGETNAPTPLDTRLRGHDGGCVALAGARMRAGTPAVPVWVPAPRSGSGTGFAGMTPPVWKAAPVAIFIAMTICGFRDNGKALGHAGSALT